MRTADTKAKRHRSDAARLSEITHGLDVPTLSPRLRQVATIYGQLPRDMHGSPLWSDLPVLAAAHGFGRRHLGLLLRLVHAYHNEAVA